MSACDSMSARRRRVAGEREQAQADQHRGDEAEAHDDAGDRGIRLRDRLAGRRRDVARHREDDRQRRRAEREADRLAGGPHTAERARLAGPGSCARRARSRRGASTSAATACPRTRRRRRRPARRSRRRAPTACRGSTARRARRSTLAIENVRSLPMRRATHAPAGRREERGGDERDEEQRDGVLGVQHPRRDVLRAGEHEPGRERLQHERRQQCAERRAAPQAPDAVGEVLADAADRVSSARTRAAKA